MSNIHEQLSPRELYLIESYKEQNASSRHHDNALRRFTAVILPLSIAALGVPYLEKEVPYFLSTLGGLTLMTFWIISCQTSQIRANVRHSIINEIEEYWNVPGHKDFRGRRDLTYGNKLRNHYLRCCVFLVYLLIIWALTLYRLCISCSPKKDFMTGIIELLVILVVTVVVSIVVGWAMHKASKKVCLKDASKTAHPESP